jgi:hypothetical protein
VFSKENSHTLFPFLFIYMFFLTSGRKADDRFENPKKQNNTERLHFNNYGFSLGWIDLRLSSFVFMVHFISFYHSLYFSASTLSFKLSSLQSLSL